MLLTRKLMNWIENEFHDIDTEIGSVPVDSLIDKYLAKIQLNLKDGTITKEFVKSNFWIHPKASSFILSENKKIDPLSLCLPRVFLWFPHYLQNNLRCPTCNSKFEVKGFNT
ncbi:unnamed protein product [Mucor hiemalis]